MIFPQDAKNYSEGLREIIERLGALREERDDLSQRLASYENNPSEDEGPDLRVQHLHAELTQCRETIKKLRAELEPFKAMGGPHDGCVSNADHWAQIADAQKEPNAKAKEALQRVEKERDSLQSRTERNEGGAQESLGGPLARGLQGVG